MRDLIAGIVFVAMGLFATYWLIPAGVRMPSQIANPALSPAFWPRIISGMLVVFGLLLALQSAASLLRVGVGQPPGDPQESDGEAPPTGLLKPALALGLLIPYYTASLYLGFLIPSIAAYVVYAFLAGERRGLLVVSWGVILPMAVTLFFIKVANILIPLGPLSGLIP